MGLSRLTQPFPWRSYSKKLSARIERPHSAGRFIQQEAEARGMQYRMGKEGAIAEGNYLELHLLLDPEDGVIVDCRFQAFGQSALIGAAEGACELLVGKNYLQARRIVTADFIDKHLRDKPDEPAFPKETWAHINLVVGAIEEAAELCMDIPVSAGYVSPVPLEVGEVLEGGIPGWDEMPLKAKVQLINEVLDEHVRPYIALDDGGIEVLNLIDNRELIIAYQGNCTSCFSAVGATLNYIQQTLRARVHPDIVVVPDMPANF